MTVMAPGESNILVRACENCGTYLEGPFCHACGQGAEPPPQTLGGLAGHLWADLSSLDSKTLRSVGRLLRNPGQLTLEYLAGRRICFTAPLQLYLVAAALFFVVNATKPFLTIDAVSKKMTGRLGGIGVTIDDFPLTVSPTVTPAIAAERFQATATGYLPTLLIGSVTLFTFALAAAYRRPPRPFLCHAVFALHWSAFYLILMIADRLLSGRLPSGIPEMVTNVVACVYLAIALRRVYGGNSRWKALQALGVLVLYDLALAAWIASAVGLAWLLG